MCLILVLVGMIWERACLRPHNVPPPLVGSALLRLSNSNHSSGNRPATTYPLKNTTATVSPRFLLPRTTKNLLIQLFTDAAAARRLKKQHPGITPSRGCCSSTNLRRKPNVLLELTGVRMRREISD